MLIHGTSLADVHYSSAFSFCECEAAMNIKRILVPYDFSGCSSTALEYAGRLAIDSGARIYMLHVDELLDARISVIPAVDWPGVHESSWEKRRRWFNRRLAKVVPLNAPVTYEHHCVMGSPADEILAFADRVHVDLIVMGSHGRTGLSRLITGSVAEKVMRGSKRPVLIVKSPVKRTEAMPVVVAAESPALCVGKDFAI
jgi:nucleotide-binding universal stress UspA family protein